MDGQTTGLDPDTTGGLPVYVGPAAETPVARLRVVYTADPLLWGREMMLDGGPQVVGRGAALGGGPPLCDPALSRMHFAIEPGPSGAVELVDLGSRNGTFVDGERVERRLVVSPGRLVRAGGTLFGLELGPRLDMRPTGGEAEVMGGGSLALREARRQVAELAAVGQPALFVGPPGCGKATLAEQYRRVWETKWCTGEKGSRERMPNEGEGYSSGEPFRFVRAVEELSLAQQAALVAWLRARPVLPAHDRRGKGLAVTTREEPSELLRQRALLPELFAVLSAGLVRIPPLAERRADVVTLAHHFLGPGRLFHPLAMEALCLHSWPFNGHDLRTVVALAAASMGADGDSWVHLSAVVRSKLAADRLLGRASSESESGDGSAPRHELPDEPTARRTALAALLTASHGNVAEVARLLGKRVTSVRRWLHGLGLDPSEFRP